MDLENEFLRFINTKNLFKIGSKLVLGISGGKDSIVLWHLLKKTGHDVVGAHCNFQLRGEESYLDETFVVDLLKNEPTHHVKKFNTLDYVNQHKCSTQIAARELRYSWFRELMDEHKYDYLLLAHHLNDRIETTLYNMTKGTGPMGILGIPLSPEKVRRPLLFCSSQQIEDYAKENGLEWREDSSNGSTKYNRNRIRHKILPELKKINPGIETTMAHNYVRWESSHEIFEHALQAFKEKIEYTTENHFLIPYAVLNATPGIFVLLEETLKPYGYTFSQVSNILTSKSIGSVFETRDFQAWNTRAGLEIIPKDLAISDLLVDAPGIYTWGRLTIEVSIKSKIEDPSQLKNPNNCSIPYEQIQWPLRIRKWKTGDKFMPFGMTKKKLVSDYLIDSKVEQASKNEQAVLLCNDKIAWILGRRGSEEFKIKDTSKMSIQIRIQ
ncbi:MAG: tRNA lysidine(34) synthetase TilS [Leadbetterella sp.]